MKTSLSVALTIFAFGALAAQPAPAQSVGFMLDECGGFARQYFGDNQARTDMRDNGRRVDGTYTIGGDIYLEARKAYAVFVSKWSRLVPAVVRSLEEAGLAGPVVGVPSNDILNVRSGPSTNHRIVGALANGDQVRNLGCETSGGSTWCQIEMMSDMRERGWVNARYLSLAGTSAGAGGEPTTTTERVRLDSGMSGVELSDSLTPGSSKRYVLNAQNGQDLYVRVAHRSGPRLDFQIFNPDGSFLLEMIPSDREYRGQLWQSGDHVIEVINRGGATADYNIIMSVN